MPSAIWNSTIQAALLNVTSAILAQLVARYRGQGKPAPATTLNPLGLDLEPILQFLILSIFLTPPNVIWQQFLERKFPGYPATSDKQKIKVDDDGKGVVVESKLHVGNTASKWLLDQTLGSWTNTSLLICSLCLLRGGGLQDCVAALHEQFWSLQKDGYKLWPLVSMISFLLIPPARRVVVGAAVGLFWNVYLVTKLT